MGLIEEMMGDAIDSMDPAGIYMLHFIYIYVFGIYLLHFIYALHYCISTVLYTTIELLMIAKSYHVENVSTY
jgi:hypothetical protein